MELDPDCIENFNSIVRSILVLMGYKIKYNGKNNITKKEEKNNK